VQFMSYDAMGRHAGWVGSTNKEWKHDAGSGGRERGRRVPFRHTLRLLPPVLSAESSSNSPRPLRRERTCSLLFSLRDSSSEAEEARARPRVEERGEVEEGSEGRRKALDKETSERRGKTRMAARLCFWWLW